MRFCISSGHSTECQGAVGILNEVREATRVVDQLAIDLRDRGHEVMTYHDTISTSQNENLNRIVDWHNSHARDLDISVHFNAYVETSKPMGTEVLYVTQQALAARLSEAIADCGFPDRGAKKRTDLFFLNNTAMPAVLLEICFVDSEYDAATYINQFEAICANLADVAGGEEGEDIFEPPGDGPLFHAIGACSTFGGPDDFGVDGDEGLALHEDITDDNQHLFLPMQPDDTSGLARRLNPYVHYIACRWNYDVTPKDVLADGIALVRVPSTGQEMAAFCADWGPAEYTGRVADLSPGLLADLGLETDDDVEIVFPHPSASG
jgi:N-acetylmuramoyl-L-alanine amidase